MLNKHLSRLQQEAIISRRIITKLINENNLSLKFTACKVPHSNTINIILRSDDPIILQEFDSILYSWIPKIIKLTMEYMQRYDKTYIQRYRKRRKSQKIDQKQYKINLNKSCMWDMFSCIIFIN